MPVIPQIEAAMQAAEELSRTLMARGMATEAFEARRIAALLDDNHDWAEQRQAVLPLPGNVVRLQPALALIPRGRT